MSHDETFKRLKKKTSQVEDFIAEMEKVIAQNKVHYANNKRHVAENREKIAKNAAEIERRIANLNAITRYTKDSLARMRQDQRLIEEEYAVKLKAAVVAAQMETDNNECSIKLN